MAEARGSVSPLMLIRPWARPLRADPRPAPGFRQIFDFRHLSELRLTSAGVSTVARHYPFPRDARRGIVVPTEGAFGLARMFQIYMEAESDHMGIFRAMGPALEWIGLDAATPWPAQAPDAVFGEE
ncbi:MAG TPA: hypothetical protein VEU09_08215 [Candidatus Binatia bacterium]|nr:hypothetical protein [Candidatus Binatia bacterium]